MGEGFLSRFIESVIGQAKKAKGSLESKAGLAPILSLESRLPVAKLKQLVDLVSDRFVAPSLPLLKDKNVLEIGEGPLRFQKVLAEKRPKFLSGVLINGSSETALTTQSVPLLVLKGALKSIPFEDQFFDCIVARLTTPLQGDVVSAFKEIGRTLSADGKGLIIDFHPFGLYAKSGTLRLRSVQATIRGVEDYFKMCRMAGLTIADVHEGFVDDTLRNQFTTPEEMNAFREIKGTPLVLFLQVTKHK